MTPREDENLDSARRVAQLFAGLELAEIAMAELYGWLSSVLRDDAEVSQLFSKMQVEELRHAHWVKGQEWRATLGKVEPPDFGDRETARVVELARRFREENPKPSVGEALRFVVALEASVAEAHRRLSQGNDDPSVLSMLQTLGADDEHVADLEALMKKRGLETD